MVGNFRYYNRTEFERVVNNRHDRFRLRKKKRENGNVRKFGEKLISKMRDDNSELAIVLRRQSNRVRLLSRFTRRCRLQSPSELGSKRVEIARWPFVMGKVNLELSVVSLGLGTTRRGTCAKRVPFKI